MEGFTLSLVHHTPEYFLMLVSDFIRAKYVPSRIEIAEQYEQKLYSVAAKFSAFLDKPATLADFTDQTICDYLSRYRKSWSARSTNNQRQILLSLWQDASDRMELLPLLIAMPNRKRIRKLPEEIDPPEAWSIAQVASLMNRASSLNGSIGNVSAAAWWLSLFLSIYWTSCRISSMLAVPSSAYDGKGLLVRKQKNHRPQWFSLPDSCRKVLEQTRPRNRQLVWQHPWHPRTIWAKARKIIESAGLPSPRTGRQLFHRLRRTTITMCAAIDPAVAQRTAGHRDYATTLKHYVDPRMLRNQSAADILPDPLEDAANESPIYSSHKFRIYG
jgi:hypothetical protein